MVTASFGTDRFTEGWLIDCVGLNWRCSYIVDLSVPVYNTYTLPVTMVMHV